MDTKIKCLGVMAFAEWFYRFKTIAFINPLISFDIFWLDRELKASLKIPVYKR